MRRCRVFLDFLADLETVHAGHHDVQQHDIRHRVRHDFKSRRTVISGENLVILDQQFCFEQTNVCGYIVND